VPATNLRSTTDGGRVDTSARPRSFRPWLREHVSWVVAAATFVVYAAFALAQHAQFRTSGYDLGLADQVLTHYARFDPPYAALAGPSFNMLGDHFSPIVATLTPLYWLWSDPRLLLVAQALLVALSVPVVYRFVVRHLGSGPAPWLTVGYAVSWPLQAMVAFDFHEVAFAVPLIALAVDALDRRDDRILLLCCLGLVLVKEDMGVLVVTLGALRALLGVPRRPGLVVCVVGVAGYLVATAFVLPALGPDGGVNHWSYDALGPDLSGALGFIARHPVRAFDLFFLSPPVKSATLLALLGPLLLLPLRSPYVLAAAPLLAERFFSSRETLWGPFFHYSAPVWPILFLAAVDGARRFQERGHRVVPQALSVSVALLAVVGTCTSSALFPLHRLVDGDAFRTTPKMVSQRAALDAIPPHTCVAADDRLTPHLTQTNLVSNPGRLGRPADFVALDLSHPIVGEKGPDPRMVQRRALANDYVPVLSSGPMVVYRSPDYRGPTDACRP
jgi:uncharacterized membrane protein